METARDLARQGCPHFTVVVAGRQTRGRGRLQRAWQSAAGGLYFTLVLRPEMPPGWIFRINFAASLVLAEVLDERYGIDARLKWPNDVLVGDRKICGMLSEMEAEPDAVHYVNIGMGVNVNNDPTPAEAGATSLCLLLSRRVPRKQLLADILERLEERLQGSLEGVIETWKGRTVTLNRWVRVVTGRETHEGLAVDVAEDGALVLRLADGSHRRVIYGDCFHSGGP
jgi:BirA family biotin operon repressor/biotin-[acetyl-CoA-carboxylase] ligase